MSLKWESNPGKDGFYWIYVKLSESRAVTRIGYVDNENEEILYAGDEEPRHNTGNTKFIGPLEPPDPPDDMEDENEAEL